MTGNFKNSLIKLQKQILLGQGWRQNGGICVKTQQLQTQFHVTFKKFESQLLLNGSKLALNSFSDVTTFLWADRLQHSLVSTTS